MPTVLRRDGYRFYFYSHEPNEPPHVHVDKAGASAKFWLQPVALAKNMGYPAHEIGELLRLVRSVQAKLMEDWRDHFGSGG